nr:PAS domain S-box protein [Bacteroidota bacterium]
MDNHQNMEIFREVVDHMATGLVVYEPVNNGENFRIREINNAGLKIGRQKREHVVGRLVTDVYPGVVDLGLFEVFQKVFKTGKAISFPLNYYRDERIDLWVENHVFKLPSGDVVAVYQDVTESEKTKQILEKRNREFETQNEELAAQNEELVALNEEIRQTYDQLNDLTNKSTIEKDKAQNYLDIAGVMFIALNHKGVVTLCNKKASEVLGYNENEITGRNWFDNFLPYRNLAAVKNVFAELIQGNIEPVEFYENPVITSAGEERIIAWHNAILRNDNGEITGLLSSGEDITESEKAAQKLTEAKKDWEAVFEAIGHPTIILNKNFQLIHANKSTEKLTGKPLSDLIGMHCFKVFHSEKATCAPGGCPMNALINKGEIKTVEMEMEAFGGYYLVSCTPVFDDQGEIQKVIHIATDITERKKAETALKVNEERFDLAMQAANDGLYDWDLVTNQIYYSPRWKGMLGYEDHELKSDFSVWERLTEPGDVKRSWEMLNELIEKKRDRFEMEFKMLHKDGHWVDILSRANAIFDENGKAFRVVGTHVDISEKKRQELILIKNQDQISRQYKKLMALNEELKEFVMRTSLINEDLKVAKERAEQSDRLKSAFLANMSHEIRTPMNGILGFADLLKEPGLTGDQHQKYIRIIEQSGKRMLSTINDLIDISRIESGAMEVS